MPGTKIVVTGATGNIGTATLKALAADDHIGEIVGLSRRRPAMAVDKTTWHEADVRTADLTGIFSGAQAVVHLAWLFQPTRDPVVTWDANVGGSLRVIEAAVSAAVPTLIHLSSVGAYSSGPKDRAVDENWPTDGWPGAAYTREKAYLERVLDAVEARHPELRVVRLRPGFVLQRAAASEQRRLFGGPFLPQRLVRPALIPVVPDLPGLCFQVLHAADVAAAVRAAIHVPARGPFNLAAEPVVDAALLAQILGAKVVRVPLPAVRNALALAWYAHLVPAAPGLFDAVFRLPIMDTRRAREELGWWPKVTAVDALREVIAGMGDRAGTATPPLAPDSATGRAQELVTGVGQRP